MKEIRLTQDKVAIVDDQDFAALSAVKWRAVRRPHTFYAVRAVPNPDGVGPRQKLVRMHRLVLARKLGRPIAPGMMPDHEDGDGLNNQSNNLIEVTHRGNLENLHIAKSSQYLGVSWNKGSKKWFSYVKVKGKMLNLGYYADELEAALARERYIEAHPELGAGSNFPADAATG